MFGERQMVASLSMIVMFILVLVISFSSLSFTFSPRGQITLLGLDEFKADQMRLDFQNEYITASRGPGGDQKDTIVATTPDIISVVDSDTGITYP